MSDFNPMAWARLCRTFYFNNNMSRAKIAQLLSVTEVWVRDHIALTHLTTAEQNDVADGTLPIKEALRRLAERRATAPSSRMERTA